MKSLLLAPALVSFVSSEPTERIDTKPELSQLIAIATVEEVPLIELVGPAPPGVPIAAKAGGKLPELQAEIEELAANLQATQKVVENVALQRDQAREEVRALATANHDMLQEMKAFREEMEAARKESLTWKSKAHEMEAKANDTSRVLTELQDFRSELQTAMADIHAMKTDIEIARAEIQDPIERAQLKEQLAQSQEKQRRLGDEVEMALIAREKVIVESARTQKELEGKMATLMQQAQNAKALQDELRESNAGKMKALADIEILRKELEKSVGNQEATINELQVAQEGLLALQAEKAAAVEETLVAVQERDEALGGIEEMQAQLQEVRQESEISRQTVEALTSEIEELELSRQVAGNELDQTSGELAKAKEEVVFLNKAKGGLEELLFKKTAEIRKLKGEIREIHAANNKKENPPVSPESERTEEGEDSPAEIAD